MSARIIGERSIVETATSYGAAKSQQDIEAALSHCTPDFVLEAPALGAVSRGLEVRGALRRFYAMLPDYRFVCEGAAAGPEGQVVLWGRARGTWRGRIPIPGVLGAVRLPVERLVDLEATCVFETRDGLLSKETFLFDSGELARQLRVPASLLSRVARAEARRRDPLAVEVKASIVIRAPIDEVFAKAFLDVGQLMRCNPPRPLPRAKRIELVGDRVEPGAIRRVHLTTGYVVDEHITAVEAPHVVAYTVDGWGLPVDLFVASTQGRHVCHPHPDGTEIVWRGEFQARSRAHLPFVRAIRDAVYEPFFRRFLRSIKHDIEEGAL